MWGDKKMMQDFDKIKEAERSRAGHLPTLSDYH